MRCDDKHTCRVYRQYTRYPHLAGTEGEARLAAELYDTWTRQGLDYVTTDTYDVLLSYPNRSEPNYVSLLDAAGRTVHRSQLSEKTLSPDQNHSDVVPPFNAYSPPGHVHVRASPHSSHFPFSAIYTVGVAR